MAEEELRKAQDVRKFRAQRKSDILTWVPSIFFKEKHQGKLKECIEGTGEWLLSHEAFQSWKFNDRSTGLWVHGKHGCGKSHLAALVIDRLENYIRDAQSDIQQAFANRAVAYVYCSRSQVSITYSQLIGSILKQLYDHVPLDEDFPRLENRYTTPRIKAEPPTRTEMIEAIEAVVEKFDEVFIIVDGLDECHTMLDEGFRFEDFCNFLGSLTAQARQSSATKVIVFSRPDYGEISRSLLDWPSVRVDAGANSGDIEIFISKALSQLKNQGAELKRNSTPGKASRQQEIYDAQLKRHGPFEEIKNALLSRADGMFLWVSLIIPHIEKQRTINKMNDAIRRLPLTLNGIYELAIERLLNQGDGSEEAIRILIWITNAHRPLSRQELLEALAVDPEDPEMDELDEDHCIHDDTGLMSQCSDLIILKDNHYHLIHTSLKDYLLDKLPASTSTATQRLREAQLDAQRMMVETCLRYLNFREFHRMPPETREEYDAFILEHPFFQYAAKNWAQHFKNAQNPEINSLAKRLVMSDGPREIAMLHAVLEILPAVQGTGLEVFGYSLRTSPLHLIICFDLVQLADCVPLPPLSTDFEIANINFSLFDCAWLFQSRQMCEWLVDNQVDSNSTYSGCFDPVLVAAAVGLGDKISTLVSKGYGVNVSSFTGIMPLHIAACEGHNEAVKALLAAGAIPDVVEDTGQTALLFAAEMKHWEVVRTLLLYEVQVTRKGSEGATALHHAAKGGSAEACLAIIQKDPFTANILAYGTWNAKTPLHCAAESGAHSVVSLLISHNANLEAKTATGDTALLLAAKAGHFECLKVLISKGANVRAINNDGECGLHQAAAKGPDAALELLLSKCSERTS